MPDGPAVRLRNRLTQKPPEAEPKRRKPGRRRRAVRVEDLRGDGAVPYVMGNFPTMFRPMFKVRLRPLLPRSSAPALWCGG